MYYIGVDYHLEVAVACIMGPSGNVLEKISLPATTKGMDMLIERMAGKRFKVLGEAFTYSMDLHNYLVGKGVDSQLANPEGLHLITRSYKKTDENDCEAIAWYLRLHSRGEIDLPMSYIVKDEEMRLRDLCRLRNDMSNARGSTSQRISAHMRRNGEYLPADRFGADPDISAKKVQKHIIESFQDDFTLQEYLRMYVYYTERCAAIDAELSRFSVDRFSVELLSSIPGIGETTAVMLMSMIVRVDRFPSADAMRSYFGMAPRVRDSGETVKHGHITKRGDPMMRSILCRAVFVHMRWCPESRVKAMYDSVSARAPKKVALTAAANKLLDVIYSVLSTGTRFHV